MPKRIVMLPPFDVLTGNLSGGQDLKYALNNNPAFDAPEGKVNYARNYKPRYIGFKRGSDGLTYYSVRTKNGVNTNAQTKLAMALLGGTGALRAAILRDASVRQLVEEKYEQGRASGYIPNISFSKYVFDICYNGLKMKSAAISFMVPEHGSVNIYNPWCYTNQHATGHHVDVGTEVLVKFWPQLASNPITFTVQGAKGVAHNGDTFQNIMTRRYNVLGLADVSNVIVGEQTISSAVAIGETEGDVITILTNAGTYPAPTDSVLAVNYTLTEAEPNPG